MEYFLGVAAEKGITEEEIGLIQAVVMSVSGGRVRAQFKDVQSRLRDAKKGKNNPCAPPR